MVDRRLKNLSQRSYKVTRHVERTVIDDLQIDKTVIDRPEYLSGLFTHTYEGELYLQYRCPLCGDDVFVARKLENNLPIDFEKHVAGEMTDQLKHALSEHYKYECGMNRERRIDTADILFDKFNDRYYS